MSAVLVSVLMDMVASSLMMNNKGGNPGYYDSGVFFFSFLIFPFEAGRGRRTPSASGGGSRRRRFFATAPGSTQAPSSLPSSFCKIT